MFNQINITLTGIDLYTHLPSFWEGLGNLYFKFKNEHNSLFFFVKFFCNYYWTREKIKKRSLKNIFIRGANFSSSRNRQNHVKNIGGITEMNEKDIITSCPYKEYFDIPKLCIRTTEKLIWSNALHQLQL